MTTPLRPIGSPPPPPPTLTAAILSCSVALVLSLSIMAASWLMLGWYGPPLVVAASALIIFTLYRG